LLSLSKQSTVLIRGSGVCMMTQRPQQRSVRCSLRGAKGRPLSSSRASPRRKKDTWEHLVEQLTEKYASTNTEDQTRAFQKAMKLKQKSDEELRAYAKRAKKLAKKVDPTLEKAVAAQFVHGIRNRSIRVTVAANSQGKSDYTFKDVYQAVQAVARARRNDSDSESDSDSDSSSSSSATDSPRGGGSKRAHDAKRSKDYKAKEEEVDAKVTTPAPRFDMDELAKVIKEAVQATTRELVGSYGLGPGPVLGQPPQAPVIESHAVSSSSRPQFQGRGHPYGGQGGGYQQQFGGQPQQSGQQFGGYQQQPGQQFGGQQQSGLRSSTATVWRPTAVRWGRRNTTSSSVDGTTKRDQIVSVQTSS
jgi:hypothetical protein